MRVVLTADALRATYNTTTGLFNGTGWWNSANGITALALVSHDLGTHAYDTVFDNTFRVAPTRFAGFLNEFYDDEGWWALAWLDVYDLDTNPRYLATSEHIFDDMTGGWSDICGGGIWWKKNEHYKNAIANELFLSVATRLALLHTGPARLRYLQWAKKEEKWFLSSGMINGQFLVNDGLDPDCRNNGRNPWSYNQGVLLTGLLNYNKLTHDPAALAAATRIASAAITGLSDKNGVLHDPCEPDCGDDGPQFKGVFLRNLANLVQSSPTPEFRSFIKANADSLWTNARTGSNHFATDWTGPAKDSGTSSLISALDGLRSNLPAATLAP